VSAGRPTKVGPASIIATCPETGQQVFPDMSVLREPGPYFITCPACGHEHQWQIGAELLIDISGDKKNAAPKDGA
jgi:transcription elongation factor Elf1